MFRNDETLNRVKRKRSLSLESNYCLCKQGDRNDDCKLCDKARAPRKRSLSFSDIEDDSNQNRRISYFQQNNFQNEPTSKKNDGLKTDAIGQLKVWRFVCKSCNRGFSNKRIFNKHVFGKCEKGKFYYCEYCGNEYSCKLVFDRHMSEHRLLACNICKKNLLSNFGLKKHLKKKHTRKLAQTHVKDVKVRISKLNKNSANEINGTLASRTKLFNKNSTTKVEKTKEKLHKKNSMKTKDVKKSRKKLPNGNSTSNGIKNTRTKPQEKNSASNDMKSTRTKPQKKNSASNDMKSTRTKPQKKNSASNDMKSTRTKPQKKNSASNDMKSTRTKPQKKNSASNDRKSMRTKLQRERSNDIKNSRMKISTKKSIKTEVVKEQRTKLPSKNSEKAKNTTKSMPKRSSRNSEKTLNMIKQIEKLKTKDFCKKSVKMRNVSKEIKESKTKNSMESFLMIKSVVNKDEKLASSSNNYTKIINLTKRVKKVNARDPNNSAKTKNISLNIKTPRTKDCSEKSVKMRNVPNKVKKQKTDFNMNSKPKRSVVPIGNSAISTKKLKTNPSKII